MALIFFLMTFMTIVIGYSMSSSKNTKPFSVPKLVIGMELQNWYTPSRCKTHKQVPPEKKTFGEKRVDETSHIPPRAEVDVIEALTQNIRPGTIICKDTPPSKGNFFSWVNTKLKDLQKS